MNEKELAKEAIAAKEKSYAPYSNFNVGAALLTKENKLYIGANIENAAYGPSNCAERTAFFKAVSEGEREFKAIAIAGSLLGAEAEFCYPCGVCRQVMREFCDSDTFEILVVKDENQYQKYLLKDLLPFGFGPEDLNK